MVRVGATAAPAEGYGTMSPEETLAYITKLDEIVKATRDDIRKQLVWISPRYLSYVLIEDCTKVTKDDPSATYDYLFGDDVTYKQYRSKVQKQSICGDQSLYDESDLVNLCNAATGKSESAIEAQINFSRDVWAPWFQRWAKFAHPAEQTEDEKRSKKIDDLNYTLLALVSPIGYLAFGPTTDWGQTKKLHEEFNALYDQFVAFGGKPSMDKMDVPSASAFVDLGNAIGLAPTMTKVLTVGAVLAGGYIVFKYVVPIALPLVFPELALARGKMGGA